MKNLIVALILISVSISCKKKNEVTQACEPTQIYTGCCGLEPVEYVVGSGKVYIANMYTPDWDGINDVFKPIGDKGIRKFIDVKIWNREDSLIWEKDSITPGISGSGWTPLNLSNESYTGLFKYNLVAIDTNNVSLHISGTACCFICDAPTSVIGNIDDCSFPDQANDEGVYNPSNWTAGLNCD